MLRRVVGLVGLALAVTLIAGCGSGPPDFVPGPGKVRASPVPPLHGGSHPANITVDGVGLYVFTHGVRHIRYGPYEVNLSAIPNPSSTTPSHTAVQAWLAKGQSMQVAGLTVKVLAVYPGDGESGYADLQVTGGATGASATASNDVS